MLNFKKFVVDFIAVIFGRGVHYFYKFFVERRVCFISDFERNLFYWHVD